MSHKRQSDRTFGLSFSAIFVVIFFVSGLVFDIWPYWVLWVATVFILASLTAPYFLLPLNRIWFVVTLKLGKLTNFILLTAFFFLFILPTGLIARVFGYDPMNRKLRNQETSYWSPVDRQQNADTLKDLF